MMDTTVLAVIWGAIATVASSVLYLARRITVQELESILSMVRQARDELSEGGKKITVDEALAILDKIIEALEE